MIRWKCVSVVAETDNIDVKFEGAWRKGIFLCSSGCFLVFAFSCLDALWTYKRNRLAWFEMFLDWFKNNEPDRILIVIASNRAQLVRLKKLNAQ